MKEELKVWSIKAFANLFLAAVNGGKQLIKQYVLLRLSFIMPVWTGRQMSGFFFYNILNMLGYFRF